MQHLSNLADKADYKGMEEALNQEDTIKEKNFLLRPLYSDLKLIIRKMTKTEEAEFLRDYYSKVGLILSSGSDSKEKAVE